MNRATVYLLDDEPAILELLGEVVKLTGMNAQSYSEARLFFEQVRVFDSGSVLVLDLNMPDMDGIEVLRRLAQMENPPILILISGADAGVRHAAQKLGLAHDLKIIATLAKPLALDKFRDLLEEHNSSDSRLQPDKLAAGGGAISLDELRQAIYGDQLVLHYQPKINIATASITGVEALVRWQHPNLGLVYPDQFLPLTEQNGWLGALTHWVIEKAVWQEQQWQAMGLSLPISVNISADNITSLILPEQLGGLLADNKLDPTLLTLEVTESALMGELVTSLDILTRLRLKGIGLSIDDFGTGFSSLSQLHRIPFTELKIDRSFVLAMLEDKEARAIVKTCIILGHELNMQVVAEGVETREHLGQLQGLGCDVAQGYYFSRPIPADGILEISENPNIVTKSS